MSHYCPHCQKFSYSPPALNTPDVKDMLGDVPILCAHCHNSFYRNSSYHQGLQEGDEEGDSTPSLAEKKIAPLTSDDCFIICADCETMMHLTSAEYDALYDHELVCTSCQAGFYLPEKPARAVMPSASGLALKLGFIYLLILSALGLLLTPEGADFISYLAQLSDTPHNHLAVFQEFWDDFLARLNGFFL